ncbi:MAG: hypothetical protein COA86_11715 [Kangiella sp.]|nr:MAG: hypothetical protein COA86_11715 [Kangiella sp.]
MQNDNIAILNRVRLIAILGQMIVIIYSVVYFEIKLPLLFLTILVSIESIFFIYVKRRISLTHSVSQNELIFHILFDSLILAGLVYFSGGANNPFIYFLLLPVALGSFMLEQKHLLALVAIELVLYSMLNLYQRPLALGDNSPLTSFHLHLAGMWVNFILTVILLAVFGLITRSSLLKQEKKLQQLREKNLQDEQILGLGIMSANAAHELGTPLSTMAIIIDDIQHSNISDEQQLDMNLLQQQIIRCRKIIGRLNDKSHHAQQQLLTQVESELDNESKSYNCKEQLELLIERWLVYQPKITLTKCFEQTIQSNYYQISISLEQAITNLLDNAADASLENGNKTIHLNTYLLKESIVIDIKDRGIGISKQKKTNIGKQIQPSNKLDGLGWGMFLSNVSIERVGGSVHILDYKNDSHSGSLTRITLPKGRSNVR